MAWATDLYGPALDSPAVAYDSILGKTLAYIGTENGNVLAVDIASGQIIWGTWIGSPIRSTPAVGDGAVFVGTDRNPALFKLNATTGAVDCSAIAPLPIEGSPALLRASNGTLEVFIGTIDTGVRSGPLMAIDAANCAVDWKFYGFAQHAGSWDPVAAAVNATGVPLVLFGTSDPDSSVYALNALTGAEVWRFQTYNPSPGVYDVGAGVTISPPGARGFAHGVAYVPSKYGIMYALDLSSGSMLWSTNFNTLAGVTGGGRSTAALDGANLVFGFSRGMFDLNASTGAVLWQYNDSAHAEAISSPAIGGAPAHEVAAVADLSGGFEVVSLANGSELYRYHTGGYVTASPAIVGGEILIASTDGFLYSFAVGGGNDPALPTTTVTSPGDGAAIGNPNGSLLATGAATDRYGVSGVVVAVESSGTGGPWWDSATGSWVPGPIGNPATLARSPNGTSANWTFSFPVPRAGGTFQLTAYSVASAGQSDIQGAFSGFSVSYSTKGPHLRATSTYVAPGGLVTLNGGGFGKFEKVTVSLLGTPLASVTTTSTGYIPNLRVLIPSSAAFGQTSLVALGLTSGRSATAAITVANNWDQFGFNASHRSFEPNDPALDNLISPGARIWVDLAWHFDAGVAINASPVVANGVAYVGETGGTLYAVAIHNGGLLWTWSVPGGAPINSSAAVDPGRALVFVAAQNGVVYALSTLTGRPIWNVSEGGALRAPVFLNGELYVTSSSGAVRAIVEANGSTSWKVSLGSQIGSSAAIDAYRNRLLVGEANGNLVALNATSGATLWTYHGGGAIVGTPMVFMSTVYVGSTDRNITALKAGTGARLWTYRAGGAVSSSGALSDSGTPGGSSLELLVGSADGYLYVLDAVNGSLFYKVPAGSPVVGVSASKGVFLLETASGWIDGGRTYSNLTVWKYHTSAKLGNAPVIVDGTIFVGGRDGYLYAFTSYGQAPV
ncbi:MAG: PQQ-binding-like beta-propeller repeat protein [Thermoplasmata archaeon]|nr:PQQ-binding-like beta-propeller repeat protein [Thermoplasmata archaeon]